MSSIIFTIRAKAKKSGLRMLWEVVIRIMFNLWIHSENQIQDVKMFRSVTADTLCVDSIHSTHFTAVSFTSLPHIKVIIILKVIIGLVCY